MRKTDYGRADVVDIKYIYRYYQQLESNIKLANDNGSITDSYVYGTYGELLSGDNSTTKFLYNGSYGVMTEDNGLYYMRARYYNPDIKRFINQDVIKGTIADSQSLNRYSYVQGNPVSYIDPFGLSPISASIGHGILMAGIIITSIAAPEVAVPLMLIDSAWYFMDGDVYSGIANLVMMGAGGVARFAGNSIAARLFRFGFYGYVFGSSGVEFVKNGQRIYKKYHDYGKKPKLDEDTLGDFLDLTLPAVGMYIGVKGVKEAVSTPKTNTSAAKEGAGEKAEEKLIGNENIKPEESAGEKTQSEQVTDPHRTSNRTNTKSLTKENEEMPGNSNVITAKENGSEKGNDVLRDEAVREKEISSNYNDKENANPVSGTKLRNGYEFGKLSIDSSEIQKKAKQAAGVKAEAVSKLDSSRFSNVKDIESFLESIPDNAARIPWDSTINIPEGVDKFVWTDESSNKWFAECHGPDSSSQAGSNAQTGWVYRVSVKINGTGKAFYMASDGKFYSEKLLDPRRIYYIESVANDTHIPIE